MNNCTIFDLLPAELFLMIVHYLDTHSMRDLLRAYYSLSDRAVIVLGPGHCGRGAPLFFTGFPSTVYESTTSREGRIEWNFDERLIKLYEINTRIALSPTELICTELKGRLKTGMNFIHFRGNPNRVADTRVSKALNSLHGRFQFAPRTSFEYCSNTNSYNVPKKYITLPCVLYEDCLSEEYTNIAIDSRYLLEIGNMSYKHIKQLEIRFYKSETVPVITNLDLPNIRVFSVKYYRKMPLMKNVKIGYGSYSQKRNNIFEFYDTGGFDVHYQKMYEEDTHLSDYEGIMDLSFTENFQHFYFVGGSFTMIFTMFNFSNAISFFWYDTIYHLQYYKECPQGPFQETFNNRRYCGMPKVTSFIYFTNINFGTFPTKIKLSDRLEVVKLYSNAKRLDVDGVLYYALRDQDVLRGDEFYENHLRVVQICSDLPLHKVGGNEHIVIYIISMLHILFAAHIRYLDLSGCYFAEDNQGLFEKYTEMEYPTPYYGLMRDIPRRKKELKIEVVRKSQSENYHQDVLELYPLMYLGGYLTSITITQARGGPNYKGWSGLVMTWPSHLVTPGMVMEIDASFGKPVVTNPSGRSWIEIDEPVQKKPTTSYTTADDQSPNRWYCIDGRPSRSTTEDGVHFQIRKPCI